MTDTETAQLAQKIFDDAAAAAKAIGVAACPPLVIPITVVATLVDLGFADYFHVLAAHAHDQAAAQTAGVAAAEASAATGALEHAKATGAICGPCIQTFSGLIAEHKAANT